MAGAAQVLISVSINSAGAVSGAATANRALGSVEKTAQSVGTRLTSAGRTMDRAGRSLTRNLSIPVLGAAAASVKMAYDFDRSLTKIDALVGASSKHMALYREEVLKLSGETAKSPEELADALYFVTSSGFEGAAALDVLRASAKAAASGLGQTATVADAVTSAVNAYGAKNLSASKATDILVAAVREGKVEGEAFSQSIGRVIPLAAEMGIEFDQVAGNLAAMSLSGLDAAEGATALRGIMSSLLKPTKDAREAFGEMGFTVDQFRDLVKNKGVLPALLEMKNKVGDNVDMWGRLFPNVRALTGALNLNGKNAAKNVEIMGALAGAVGDTDEAFKNTQKSDAWQMAKRLNDLKIAAVKLGETLIPIALDIANAVSGMAEAFGKLDPSLQKWLILGAIAGGPALRLGGLVATGAGALAGAGGIGAAGAGATGAGAVAGGGALAAASAAALPLAAVAVVAGAGYSIYQTRKDAEENIDGLVDKLVEGKKSVDELRDQFDALSESGNHWGEKLGAAGSDALEDAVTEYKKNLGEVFKSPEGAKDFFDLQSRSIDLTKKQTGALATQIDKFGVLGVKLRRHTKQLIGNALAVGDVDSAMEMLNDAFDKGIKKTYGNEKALNRFGGSADLQRAKVALLAEGINKLPTKKEIRLAVNTAEARATLAAFVAQVNATHLAMNLNLNAGGPMGQDAGGSYMLPKAPGSYSLPFSKGYGNESVTFSGLDHRADRPSGREDKQPIIASLDLDGERVSKTVTLHQGRNRLKLGGRPGSGR